MNVNISVNVYDLHFSYMADVVLIYTILYWINYSLMKYNGDLLNISILALLLYL